MIGRPITTNPPGSAARNRSPSARIRSGSPFRALPGPSGSGRSPRGAGSESRSRSGARTWRTAIFADGGRTLIASDDSGSVSMVDVANGTTDPPAALGRRRACRLAGSQPGRAAAGRGFVRRVGLRVGREDRRAVRLPAHGRHEPGQRRRVQPRRPDARELAPALGGRLEHERRAGDRRAAGRTDRSDHRRVLQPRRQAARRGTVRRRRRSCTTRRRDDRLSGSTATRSSPRSPSTPTGSSSPSERSTGRFGSSIRRAGRPSARPLDVRERRPSGRSPSARTAGCSRWPSTRTASDGFYGQQRQGEVQLWDVDSRRRVGRAIAPGARIGALRGLQPGRHAAGDRQLRRAARPVGRGHAGPPRQADEGGGRRRPERRVRSERPARRRRRSDRTGAGLARGRSAAGLSAPRRPHRPRHRGGVRPDRLVPRDHEPVRRDQAVGPGHGSRLRRRAGRRARGPARSTPSIDLPVPAGCGTRSARTASCWPSRESRHARCCGTSTRRSGAGVPARSWAET